jgi:hypothetical protein
MSTISDTPVTEPSDASVALVPVRETTPVPPGEVARARYEIAALCLTAGLALVVVASTMFGVHYPGRAVLAVLFAIAVPGVPIVALLELPDRLVQLSLAIAVSLAANLLVASILLVGHWWHPLVGLWLLAAAALVPTPWAVRRRRARSRGPAPSIGASLAEIFAPAVLRPRVIGLSALLFAGALLALAISRTDLDAASSVGLISVIGWPYIACLVLVMAVAVYALTAREVDHLLLLGCALLLIVAFYTFVNLVEDSAVVPVSWIHVAFIRYIMEHGAVPRSVDARFSWPGFFAAGAQLTTAAGTHTASPLTLMSPAFYNAIMLPPLFVIGRTITRSARLAWLGILIYLTANWWQQDYFSPQATALVMFMAVLATLLWLSSEGARPPIRRRLIPRLWLTARSQPARVAGVSRGASVGLGLIFAAIGAAIVVSHQLTPVSVITALFIFTLTGSTRYRALWVVVALTMLAWFSYGATDYWLGHLREVVGGAGQLSSTVGSSVGGRLAGASGLYAKSQYVRIAWSAGLFLVAALGAFTIRRRPGTLLVAALGVAPFTLVLLQSYGGEVVIRCFVYAAPILAPLAALMFARLVNPGRFVRLRATVLLALLVPAALILTFTRGLNTSFERTPKDELTASQFVFDHLNAGDGVGLAFGAGLFPTGEVVAYNEFDLNDTTCGKVAPACTLDHRPRFIMIDSTAVAQGRLQLGAPESLIDEFSSDALASGLYEKVFTSPHTLVLELKNGQ